MQATLADETTIARSSPFRRNEQFRRGHREAAAHTGFSNGTRLGSDQGRDAARGSASPFGAPVICHVCGVEGHKSFQCPKCQELVQRAPTARVETPPTTGRDRKSGV